MSKANLWVRKSDQRGITDVGWLHGKHSFSFGAYRDSEATGFHALRVINEDIVAPKTGFDPHPHRNMEIITIVVEGELAHEDSTGHSSIIRPGMVQCMSAGRGIVHSERNPSETEPLHLLQIWIEPYRRGIEPRYEEKTIALEEGMGFVKLVGSDQEEGEQDFLRINQNASLYRAKLGSGERLSYTYEPSRVGWIQVIKGSISTSHGTLEQGDGLGIEDLSQIDLCAERSSDVVLFDLPKQL